GLSATYELAPGFSAGAAMFSADRTDTQNRGALSGKGDKAEAYSGGLKYDAKDLYLAALYTKSFNATRFGFINNLAAYGFADKAQYWDLLAQYVFDFGLRPSLCYVSSRVDD
ncbi:porin, partial [Erwinia amylovora]|uniref:porin n=1 Tax=Erwinia amylovora TaxID=552 RepID=UPI00200A2232